MEKVTIAKIYSDEIETKFGPTNKVSIYTVEYPEVKMSGFFKQTCPWKEGDKVNIVITKNGNYTNFKPAGPGQSTGGGGNSNLEARVQKLEDKVFGDKEAATPKDVDITADF